MRRATIWGVVFLIATLATSAESAASHEPANGASPSDAGQTTNWDSLLTNSNWYVPPANLLAYLTSGMSFTTPPPQPIGDQTLWELDTATGGVFTGTGIAVLKIGPTVNSMTNFMHGIVTDTGQIRIRFTPVDSGPATVGIGQMRFIDGQPLMEMQMISGHTGAGGALVSHWAYMVPYDPASFTPPEPEANSDFVSSQWAWTAGTTWKLKSDELFGPHGAGTFTITDHVNGYFWGPGTGPEGSATASFTQFGSITPEGNVLLNVLSGDTLTSLTGTITGDVATGSMALRSYHASDTFGTVGIAVVIPEPSAVGLWAVAGLMASVGRFRNRSKAADQRAASVSASQARMPSGSARADESSWS